VDLASVFRRDGDAIEIEDAASVGHRGSGREDPDEVERIAADSDTISPEACLVAHRAQEPDRLGERELLARSQGDEARAAQLTARLPAAIDQDESRQGGSQASRAQRRRNTTP